MSFPWYIWSSGVTPLIFESDGSSLPPGPSESNVIRGHYLHTSPLISISRGLDPRTPNGGIISYTVTTVGNTRYISFHGRIQHFESGSTGFASYNIYLRLPSDTGVSHGSTTPTRLPSGLVLGGALSPVQSYTVWHSQEDPLDVTLTVPFRFIINTTLSATGVVSFNFQASIVETNI